MEENRPRLLIIGHGRHGKDTLAEILRDDYGLSFESSSDFVGRRAVWPMWGEDRYSSYEAMFEDRVNHRELWSNLINAYNTPDLARTGREMIQELGHDMYVGMRDIREFNACMSAGIFDLVIWVDAEKRLPPEDNPKFTITKDKADIILDNNGDMEDLREGIVVLVRNLMNRGFNWKLPYPNDPYFDTESKITPMEYVPIPFIKGQEPTHVPPMESENVDLMIIPENATPVLDYGYVSLVNVNGTDADIAEAARLSYGRGTKKVNGNEGLIRYLYMNAHTSPFEMVSMKFQMRLPIFVMRQLVRHRTAHLNEYSGRYSEMLELYYVPNVEQICAQHSTNKQGSGEMLPLEVAEGVQETIRRASASAFADYHDLLSAGVSRETARILLPLNTYTEVMWQLDLNNMLKFLWLRDDSHAQWEIQVYAKIISDAVEKHFPATFAAYMRRRNSVTLTQDQIRALLTHKWEGLPKGEFAQLENLVQGFDY